jgi:hypothetical protein
MLRRLHTAAHFALPEHLYLCWLNAGSQQRPAPHGQQPLAYCRQQATAGKAHYTAFARQRTAARAATAGAPACALILPPAGNAPACYALLLLSLQRRACRRMRLPCTIQHGYALLPPPGAA